MHGTHPNKKLDFERQAGLGATILNLTQEIFYMVSRINFLTFDQIYRPELIPLELI
jgi:hypothetical protein